jgi:hypothetical protein
MPSSYLTPENFKTDKLDEFTAAKEVATQKISIYLVLPSIILTKYLGPALVSSLLK